MKTTPSLLLCAAALLFTCCSSGPSIAEKPQDDMDRRAAAMGYGKKADDIRPSGEYESLSEENLKEYDGNISAALLQDYLNTSNKKKKR